MEDVSIQALIEQGKDYCESVETDIGQFWIRPLSEGERLQLASMVMKGMRSVSKSEVKGASSKHPMEPANAIQQAVESGINKESIMDHEKWNAAQGEARIMRLAWGLSCKGKNHNPSIIKKLKGKGVKKALDKVHQAIIDLTEGVEPLAEPFPENDGGADVGSAIPSRDTSSEIAGGDDTNSEELRGVCDAEENRGGE